MKRVLLVALVILSACHRQPQEIATRNIETYLKKKFNNPEAFRLIMVQSLTKDWRQPAVDSGFVRLDSGLSAWAFWHKKLKTDPGVVEMYTDSLNKARPDWAKENNRNLKLIESGKLNCYWTDCVFRTDKRQKEPFFYVINLDTNYNVTSISAMTNIHVE